MEKFRTSVTLFFWRHKVINWILFIVSVCGTILSLIVTFTVMDKQEVKIDLLDNLFLDICGVVLFFGLFVLLCQIESWKDDLPENVIKQAEEILSGDSDLNQVETLTLQDLITELKDDSSKAKGFKEWLGKFQEFRFLTDSLPWLEREKGKIEKAISRKNDEIAVLKKELML